MLWIALYLPELPLQSAARGMPESVPLVLSDGPANRSWVAAANGAARALGVEPGMALAAAQALVGGATTLQVMPRKPEQEQAVLLGLAGWAGQFTPMVSLEPGGQGLLLEVAASLQLFGGLMPLLSKVRQGMKELGFSAVPGVAPTPLAAWWLARARHAQVGLRSCSDPAQLAEKLRPLPLTALGWPAETVQLLAELGLHKLGGCLDLPRDGFARRFGPERAADLERALGRLADPRPAYQAPEYFVSRLELPLEAAYVDALQFPLRRQLAELQGFLRGRGAGILRLDLLLEHTGKRRTRLTLGLVAPERDAARLLALLKERLGRLVLPDAVVALELRVDVLMPYTPDNASLLPDQSSRSQPWRHLYEQLHARLGNGQVFALQSADDHRPERAWRPASALSAMAEQAGGAMVPAKNPLAWMGASSRRQPRPAQGYRPVWLLRAPEPLSSRDDTPDYHGPLDLLTGPERIEAGWWDGSPASRDYYVAKSRRGELLWVYRDHRPAPGWYLHGVFA